MGNQAEDGENHNREKWTGELGGDGHWTSNQSDTTACETPCTFHDPAEPSILQEIVLFAPRQVCRRKNTCVGENGAVHRQASCSRSSCAHLYCTEDNNTAKFRHTSYPLRIDLKAESRFGCRRVTCEITSAC